MNNIAKIGLNIKNLDWNAINFEEKYEIYKQFEQPVHYALNKVFKKFPAIPLEKSDYTSIAWMAFDEAITKYAAMKTTKTLLSFVIDSIVWKCTDYAATFVTNHHKMLNLSTLGYVWCENIGDKDDGIHETTMKMVLEDYFSLPENDEQAQVLFEEYVLGTTQTEMVKKYDITRTKLKRVLDKTISDLSKILV
ncbi:sigma-70 family RNA polymerase sigma factor [Williamsoniiplasma lucivorax]|uniref:Uncharacterized protein n=1 Tax=Williamsoniiplasma lucivorax TaxID=209274 RepID=A0A2S5RF73_9MOLU|nr:sigma-70 family RNA polymerase sigma factor [Williamsoniiplasma lucivorax]PPE05862.1 hypothetical protein ELUCI_v1c01500 [Williamsoniiplasma lucivorax]